MSCADCGASLEGRHHNAYLCRPCVRERQRVRKKRDWLQTQADPLRAARRRESNRLSQRRHYVPRTREERTEPCRAAGCRRTFVRVWGASNRTLCDGCQKFYARESDNAGARRRRATKNVMRGIAA